jgi:hypothetical protein
MVDLAPYLALILGKNRAVQVQGRPDGDGVGRRCWFLCHNPTHRATDPPTCTLFRRLRTLKILKNGDLRMAGPGQVQRHRDTHFSANGSKSWVLYLAHERDVVQCSKRLANRFNQSHWLNRSPLYLPVILGRNWATVPFVRQTWVKQNWISIYLI